MVYDKTMLRFEWDDAKEALNLHLHGIDFTLAAQAALDPHRSELFDVDHSDDEDRWTIIGMAGSIPVILRVTVSETPMMRSSASYRREKRMERNVPSTSNKGNHEHDYGNPLPRPDSQTPPQCTAGRSCP
jgi:uncharacterized DUF497 family protein